MRFKAAGFILLTVILVMILGFFWQIEEIQRTSADALQFSKEKKFQPHYVDNQKITLSLSDNKTTVGVGEKVVYEIYYQAKEDLKNVRIIGVLGETKKDVLPVFSQNLGDLQADTSGIFRVPVEIKAGSLDVVVSRITISEEIKPKWWGKKQRRVLATVDDVDSLVTQ